MRAALAIACLATLAVTGCSAFASSGMVSFHLSNDLQYEVKIAVEFDGVRLNEVTLPAWTEGGSRASFNGPGVSGGAHDVRVIDMTSDRMREKRIEVDGRTYIVISIGPRIGITASRLGPPLYN